MTVAATAPIITYEYTGPADYDFPFRVFTETDVVISYLDVQGVTTLLLIGVDYTVELVEGIVGGTCKITYAPTDGTISVYRQLPIIQTTDWVNNGPFDMELLEQDFDKNVMLLQEMGLAISGELTGVAWTGLWESVYPYRIGNLVEAPDSNWYMAINDHTSSTDFDADLASGNWALALNIAYLENLTTLAAQSEFNAAASAGEALTSAADALVSEANAASSETNASLSENNAANCASEANQSAIEAEAAKDAAEALVIVGDRSDAIFTDFYTATAGQVDFTITQPSGENNIFVFMNSRKLRRNEDYTLNSASAASVMTLTSPADAGDELDVVSINTYDISGINDDMAAYVSAAEAAQVAAEDARDASVIAQGLSEDAQGLSEDARDAAAASALAAADSEAGVAADALIASNAADAALVSETNAGLSETASAASAAAALVSEDAAAASAAAALVSETNADADALIASDAADAALVSKTNASTSEDNAESYAVSAGLSEDAAAQSAIDAQSVVLQDLSSVAESLVTADTVDVFIYDTTKDSDGGLWRERCQALSWYNETLNTATRGASRKFPAVVAIIFEATQYTIFDLTDPSAPMWRVKVISGTISSGAMLNGLIVVGTGAGVYRYNYISEVEETITA